MRMLLKGTLLVAGTSIGAGMLGLPVVTGSAGFIPSLVIYLACWLFMACTGLLFMEISLWLPEDTNIISMAERTLGKGGKVAAWILYLFLFYCLTLVYITGIGDLIASVFPGAVKGWQAQLLFLIAAIPLVYVGTSLIGRLNVVLMAGLIFSYLIFLWLGLPDIDLNLLKHTDWSKIWVALPITFTAFAYQGLIPTLVTYMKRDSGKIRMAILLGTFLPFIAYVLWQVLILGIVPVDGPGSLMEAQQNGQTAIFPLKNILNVPGLYIVGQFFAFFALVTSFFGVSLGLMDFLSDGLNIKKTPLGKCCLSLMIFLPPYLIALSYPHLFLIALGYAGGIGCALLLGLLPILMVWSGRYYLGLQGQYRLSGGRVLLVVLMTFVFIELVCELGHVINS